MSKSILAWHFLPADGKLAHGDGRKAKVNQKLSVKPPLRLCAHGLHASVNILNALQRASGPVLCRVRCGGELIETARELCCEHRTVIAMADATQLLHEFACDVAEAALRKEREAGREPDKRSWAAIEAKRKWLKGEITDEELSAARSAARSAAWSAAWYAAWSAAWSAAESAAGAIAWAAARAVAEYEQSTKLEALARELLGLSESQ